MQASAERASAERVSAERVSAERASAVRVSAVRVSAVQGAAVQVFAVFEPLLYPRAFWDWAWWSWDAEASVCTLPQVFSVPARDVYRDMPNRHSDSDRRIQEPVPFSDFWEPAREVFLFV